MLRNIIGALLVTLAVPLAAQSVSGQGTWETTLQPRDVDNDGTVDAYYDTALDITWGANPGLGRTLMPDFANDSSGTRFGQRRAFEWLDYLNRVRYLGVNRWRLPRFVDVDGDGCTRGVDCGQYHDVTLSEAAYMYAVTLGNLPNCGPPRGTCPQAGGGLTNVGPFVLPDGRFGGTVWIEDPNQRVQALWKFRLSTGLQKPENLNRGKAQVWVVLDGDIANYTRRAPGPESDIGDYMQLHCPGDVDLNDVPDVVAITSGGRVITRSLDGSAAARFALEYAVGLVDTAVTADIDGNGAPELVALGTSTAEIRDLQQGELQSVVDFWSQTPSVQLEVIDDVDGNGYPEVARLAIQPPLVPNPDTRGSSVLQTRDLDTGALGLSERNRQFRNPINFVYAPRAPETTGPLFGLVFASDRSIDTAGIDSRLWITAPGERYGTVQPRYFGDGFAPIQAVALPGAGAEGLPTVAVLGTGAEPMRDGVRLLNLVKVPPPPPPFLRVFRLRFDDAVIRIGLGENFTAQQLLPAPDFNGNGAPEFIVYETETAGSRHRALINDGRTGERLGTVRFSEQLVGLDIAVCPDLNDNGTPDIALLGARPTDGGVRVIVKDGGTDELLGAVSLPALQGP